jgi:hypothetical protein
MGKPKESAALQLAHKKVTESKAKQADTKQKI